MTKALFRKQMMEVFSWLFQDKKSGKNRTKGGIIGFAVLYLLLFHQFPKEQPAALYIWLTKLTCRKTNDQK